MSDKPRKQRPKSEAIVTISFATHDPVRTGSRGRPSTGYDKAAFDREYSRRRRALLKSGKD